MSAQTSISAVATDLVEFLRQPESYPNQPKAIEVRETHISWVFLAGRYAYKLKKPVRFDFLDFSTCQLRREACEAEVRLNRRLSPSVYRAVVPVCRQKSGKLAIGGSGEVVDWLVKMRRLDDSRTLDALLTGQSTLDDAGAQVRTVAAHLAQFYTTQAPLTVRTLAFRQNLRRHVDDNEEQLLRLISSDADENSIRRVHSSQKRFLVTHQGVFDDRVRDGRIVDGHGDLRPEHIYLYAQPLVIDCVEFNAEYRTNDIVDELAFLAMESDRRGDRSVGHELFEAYANASHDIPPPRLVAFYMAYRACVRAKVAALRSKQQQRLQADVSLRVEHDYLRLAENYVRDLGPRLMLMVGGLMGTGKSTLAAELGQLLSAEVISSDVVRQRRRLAGTIQAKPTRFGGGEYSYAARMEIYKSMMAEASDCFARNDAVVLDATFSSVAMRELAIQLASACRAKPLQVECACPRQVAIGRIEDRIKAGGSASEAIPEYYDLQVADAQPPLPSVPLVRLDATLAIGQQAEVVLEHVRGVIQ